MDILPHTLPKIMNNMKFINKLAVLVIVNVSLNAASAQDNQSRIDSLVSLLKTAGREWNDYSIPLIEIGEPAVPVLVKAVRDRSLSQWNRRITAMTLNDIHSPQWVKPALEILFDRNEDPELRNHVTAGLKGFDLSDARYDLWEVYEEVSYEMRKLNLAGLLMDADTAMAYRAFYELYNNSSGYVQQRALLHLVEIRPEESTSWFLKSVQLDDWMTANLAMDSLVISVYNAPGTGEKVKWRIVYIFSHRHEPESLSLLVKALQDESWLVHTEAAVGLCSFDPGQVIPEMKALKNDARIYVRNNTRWVINRMKKY